MQLQGDAWCSSGNLWPNGNLAATGGTATGDKAIRMIPNNDDPKADFETRLNVLADVRWYVRVEKNCRLTSECYFYI